MFNYYIMSKTNRRNRKNKKSRKNKKRGGEPSDKSTNICVYNVDDATTRINSEDPYELQGIYNKCCPKTMLGLKNTKPFCKNLASQFAMLQDAKNFENEQIFKYDNERFYNISDTDYYKPRNAIINRDDNIEKGEFSAEFQGGRKSKKIRKRRKKFSKRNYNS